MDHLAGLGTHSHVSLFLGHFLEAGLTTSWHFIWFVLPSRNASGPRLASASKDGTVRVWIPSARRTQFTLGGHTASVNAVRWGGEGVIYTASSDRTVKLWNAEEGKLIRTLSEHAHWVNTLALNTDFLLRTGPFDEKAQKQSSDKEGTGLHSRTRSPLPPADQHRFLLQLKPTLWSATKLSQRTLRSSSFLALTTTPCSCGRPCGLKQPTLRSLWLD